MRTDGEGRGPGEKGRLRNRLGRRRLFAQGHRSSRLPSRLRSAPPLSRVPTPLPIPPQRRVRGNTLLGDFWYPSKCAACAFPEPWRPPATSPYNLAGHPTGYAPQHGSDEDPHHASAVPQPGTRLSGDLDPAVRAPERTERTGNLCTKGRHSRVDLEPGGTSLKVGAPQSTYTPRGPWEEVQWSQASGERKRRREAKGDPEGGREGNRGGGKREPRRRRDGDADRGARRGWRPLCLRTMGRGKGAQGGARRRAGLRRPPSRVGHWWDFSPAVAIPSLYAVCLQRPSPASYLAALEKQGVQTHFSSRPTRGGGP